MTNQIEQIGVLTHTNMNKQILIDEVIKQIKTDADYGDFTAIEELIKGLPEASLKAFLSEKKLKQITTHQTNKI